MKKEGVPFDKRGQITVFIIIGIIIIAAAVIAYLLIPKTQTNNSFDSKNPNGFLQNCLENTIKSSIENISLQGGSINPDFYFSYNGSKVEYLCYTAENYATCVVQRPLLQEHVESEIESDITSPVQDCFSKLVDNYKNEGYNVNLQTGRTIITLLPNKVLANFSGYVLNISKGETSVYNSFSVIVNNNLYELVNVANSIIDWETTYGDAPTNVYMTYYKDLKAEKMVQEDGTKVYILTDRNSGLKFQFASRSDALPPGYGVQGVSV